MKPKSKKAIWLNEKHSKFDMCFEILASLPREYRITSGNKDGCSVNALSIDLGINKYDLLKHIDLICKLLRINVIRFWRGRNQLACVSIDDWERCRELCNAYWNEVNQS